MSTLADTPLPSPVTPVPRRRITIRLIARPFAAVLALLVVGGGIGWLVYIHHYQPLAYGGEGGIFGSNVKQVSDGINESAYIATGPTGSEARLLLSVRNSGHFDVRLLGPYDVYGDLVHEKIRWLPVTSATRGLLPSDPNWTQNPVTLHPGQMAGVEVDFERPQCSPDTGYGSLDQIPIRWSALGVHHVFAIPVGGGFFPVPFYLCWPQSALEHLVR